MRTLKRLLLLAAMLLVIPAYMQAQEFIITGYAVDATNSKEALPAAQLRLFDKDSALVAATITDEYGYFSIKPKQVGKYLLKASFIGYQTFDKQVEVTQKKPTVKLGRLLLNPDNIMLKEAQVTGLAKELTIKADTFVYHANAYRVPEGASIAALIKQLPGLSMDKDGNLTFQGKTVDNILVNGKPFFGDANTAMSNMASDAVSDVKVYEKTDEEKEFQGMHDPDKKTVIDLKIKKEYMTSWNINATGGAGTHGRYLGKVFASNFTDKRLSAVYVQANNISEDQRVDENGNWQNWGISNGLFTYRRAGVIMSWENGLKNTDAGYLKSNIDITLKHNDSDRSTIKSGEQFLSNGAQFYYGNSKSYSHQRDIQATGIITYNIDTLNRINALFEYHYNDGTSGSKTNNSVFDNEQPSHDAFEKLLADDITPEQAADGVYSMRSMNQEGNRTIYLIGRANYTHKTKSNKISYTARIHGRVFSSRNNNDILAHYRYFNPDAARSSVTDRRRNINPKNEYVFGAEGGMNIKTGEKSNLSISYEYWHQTGDATNDLYRLDRYPLYADWHLPLGVRPSTADSLQAVTDIENSYDYTAKNNFHELHTGWGGTWEKLQFNLSGTLTHNTRNLYYTGGGNKYSPSKKYLSVLLNSYVNWKFCKNGAINIYHYTYSRQPDIMEQIPLANTSNNMAVEERNPDLKTAWTNYTHLSGRWFNDKRGDSYTLRASFDMTHDKVINTLQTDPVSGMTIQSKKNVNGCYNITARASTEQPLDSARHWTVVISAGSNFGRNKTFIGSTGDALGLSVVRTYNPGVNLRLKWRKDIWNVSLYGNYIIEKTRYDDMPQYDQDGETVEWSLQPQVDFPFGMKIYTSFGLYKRMGYDDDIMNHEQWLWNATISQSLLKNDALTLQLQAVDILRQRTAEYSITSPSSRDFSRTKVFHSYVMLNAIWRFNIGGKNQ